VPLFLMRVLAPTVRLGYSQESIGPTTAKGGPTNL